MKKISLVLLTLISLQINAQLTLNQKYDNYKTRLNNKFCVIGSSAGQSIPSSERKSIFSGDSINYWGDATITLGWYIGVLASEYEIKRLNNENYTQTVTELYYAINALNRLDTTAEVFYGGTANLNGFLIRDDISSNFILATNTINPSFFGSDNCLLSNYSWGCNCLPVTTCTASLYNEESQDQLYHILLGLSLSAKYCNIVHNGVNLSNESKAITHRLITYIKQGGWILKNAVTGNNVSRGENATAYCNGLATAGFNVTGNNYSDVISNGANAVFTWNIFPTLTFTTQTFLDNIHMFLATAAIANDTRASVDNYALTNKMSIYPLIRQSLYGGPNTINDTVYNNLLNSVDENGNYFYSPTSKSSGSNWHCDNMFIWPDRNIANNLATASPTIFTAEYHGLDFMLLHNLMRLKQLTLNIKEDQTNSSVSIYPNPGNGTFQLDYQITKQCSLVISDIQGNILLDKKLNESEFTSTIDMKDFVNGVYLYKIMCDGKIYKNGKVVIIK